MVVHAYYPVGEIRVEREARALVDSGYKVDVICLKRPGEPARATEHDVEIYRLPVRRHKRSGVAIQLLEYLAFFLLASWHLFQLHLRRRYCSVQVHNLPDFLIFAALLPKLMGARIVLDIHDLMPEFYAARFGGDLDSLPVKMVRFQEKASCWLANHVITVTEAWRQTLIKRGVPKHKCSVVMNLPDPRVFPVEAASPPIEVVRNSSTHLIYHGNVTRRYGLDILVKAFERVHRRLPETHLTIHGRGDYMTELEGLVDDLRLRGAVTLSKNLIPLEEVVALIQSADLAIVPYRTDVFTDGILPTKLMEYAALGMPTITARTTAIQAYFDEAMVRYFPAEDVAALAEIMVQLIGDEEQLRRLSANIRRFNQNYNWRQEARSYVQLMDNLSATG